MEHFELVPNLSTGDDPETLAVAIAAVESCGARVLHATSDATHNRSVLTIFGESRPLLDASLALAHIARERIDLRAHHGVHPRIGSLDVLPFVPLGDTSMADAVALARESAYSIWERERIPSFLYGEAALRADRRVLSAARGAGFEALPARFAAGDRPDVGDIPSHQSAGAIAIGAREILIAWNIVLESGDIAAARRIARSLRERDGGLPGIRALAFRLTDRRVQLSFNITDRHATPLRQLFEMARRLAEDAGILIESSELIGLLPRDALESVVDSYLSIGAEACI